VTTGEVSGIRYGKAPEFV